MSSSNSFSCSPGSATNPQAVLPPPSNASIPAATIPTASRAASLSAGQWTLRSFLVGTSVVAVALGIWRIEERAGAIFAIVAFPGMLLSTAERFWRLSNSSLAARSIDLFMAAGGVILLGYCSPIILESLMNGSLFTALVQTILATAFGAATGVVYCLLVLAFYGVAKAVTRW